MNKLRILALLIAFTILGISIWVTNVQQHTNTRTETADENMDEWVEVVEPTPEPPYKQASWYNENSEIQTYIEDVFGKHANWGLSVAFCESGFNPDAESPSGTYLGLYQFCHDTFDSNCSGSIYEWQEQVICAWKLYDRGETSHWPNCP